MKLQVEQALAQPGEEFSFALRIEPSAFDGGSPFEQLTAPAVVEGSYFFDGERLHVEGIITTRGHYTCTRCLDEADLEMEISFCEYYMQMAEADDDALVYDGRCIDVLSLVRDTLIIEEPYQVLCREDCKGLCSRCGHNLNEGSCECNDAEMDPRWAALAAWKKKQ